MQKRTSRNTAARATPARRSQAERREAARERILDAAEELFGKIGFYGVTLRDVAAAAEADTALLHYYFEGKAGLFDEVVARRAELVNRTRLESLDRYERESAGKMTAHGVVSAYLTPTFTLLMSGGAGFRHYARVISKVNSTGLSEDFNVSVTPFDPVVQKMISMLKRVRPERSEADLYWFYHMLSGAISLSLAETGRIDALSGGLCKSSDFEAILARMVAIFSAGFDGLPNAQDASSR
ncbi:MAG TPA: TetR/AcrR family transcriptional regulator [Terricaulis sp.]|nr:TetR/AcrR family transcriptional regulator [Terricaulis sp.]